MRDIEETKQGPSILEQEELENLDAALGLDPTSTFADLTAFTSDVLQQDVDAFENRIEEIALDVGVAFDKLTGNGEVDLLYMTSIGFLIVLTVAIVSALFSYKQCKLPPLEKPAPESDLLIAFCSVEAACQRRSAVSACHGSLPLGR